MRKLLISILAFICSVSVVQAYTVQSGDSLWKIAQNAKIGLTELINANPQLENPNLIYPGQEINLGGISLGGTTAAQPIAGNTYNLAGSGITASQSTITLQSLTIKQTGYKILDSDLSEIFYLTLEPGSNTRQEIVSCSTVTQNSGGTATLSGCSRGLLPFYPYSASSTYAFSHGGGTQAIFSDPPQLFNQLGYLDNNNTWSGLNAFGTSTYSATDKGYIQVGTTTPIYFKNIGGVSYYCNDGASCATIGGGASTYGFQYPLTTSGSQVRLNTSTQWFRLEDTTKLSLNTTTGSGIDQFWKDSYIATTTKESLTISKNLTVGGDLFNNTNIVSLTASTTITGATTPQPVYIASSTDPEAGGVLLVDGNATSTLDFYGFAITSATQGQTVYVQTDGIVDGFTGLTKGANYYVQETAGTIGTTVAPIEILVGQAISTTQLLIKRGTYQFMGNIADDTDNISVPPNARFVNLEVAATHTGAHDFQQNTFLSKIGKRVATLQSDTAIADTCLVTATWNVTTNIIALAYSGTNCLGVSAVAYFYY